MSNVYIEKPNIVTVQMSDATGTADRFIVGKSLDEVIAIIQPEPPCAGPKPKKKDRKPRRTKAEIAKDIEAAEDKKEDAANTGQQKETVWP